jgi:hypothetical protein
VSSELTLNAYVSSLFRIWFGLCLILNELCTGDWLMKMMNYLRSSPMQCRLKYENGWLPPSQGSWRQLKESLMRNPSFGRLRMQSEREYSWTGSIGESQARLLCNSLKMSLEFLRSVIYPLLFLFYKLCSLCRTGTPFMFNNCFSLREIVILMRNNL